jgi:alpha-beta hydrolase superfamily lysophospholipase
MMRVLALLALLIVIGGCAEERQPPPAPTPTTPPIEMADGTELPLRYWPPQNNQSPKVIVLGIHGFNDHAGGFSATAAALNEAAIGVYAFDQRGFGRTESRGRWPGTETLVDDAIAVTQAIQAQHPEQPLYIMGHSMGAAVTTLMLERASDLEIAGSVLVAPAFWARQTMPWYQRWALWAGERLTHPYWIRDTRVDALAGVVSLMDTALNALPPRPSPPRTLILYGLADEVIPPPAACAMLRRFPPKNDWQAVIYPDGYHMLTRYTGAEQTLADLRHYLLNRPGAMPSSHSQRYAQVVKTLCAGAAS